MKKRFGIYHNGAIRFDSTKNGCYLHPVKRPIRKYAWEMFIYLTWTLTCLILIVGMGYILSAL